MDLTFVYLLVFAAVALPVAFWGRTRGERTPGRAVRGRVDDLSMPGLFRRFWGLALTLEMSVGRLVAAARPSGRRDVENLIRASGLPLTYERLCVLQVLFLFLFGAVGAVFLLIPSIPPAWGVGLAACGALFGWFYPRTTLRQHVESRKAALTRALPFAIDLIGAAMRSGLEFGAALRYFVALRMGGPLEEEFAPVLKQVELGKTRVEALADMAARVQVEAFTSFVGVVSYGTEIGASIVETLKVHGEELRRARFNIAERKAARAPSLMILPMAVFIMPAVFIIVITPIVMQMRALGLGAH